MIRIQQPYQPVGQCIYCLKSGLSHKLSNEHIIPLSLNGTLVLPNSSCDDCASITSRFEREVAQKNYGILRRSYSLKSRRPKRRVLTVQMQLDGQTIDFPVEATPTGIPWFHFPISDFCKTPVTKRTDWTGTKLEYKRLAPANSDLFNSLIENKTFRFEHSQSFNIQAHAILMAKIAHSFAIATFGIHSFEHWLPPYILGKDPHLPYLIGGLEEELEPVATLHQLKWNVGLFKEDFLIWVDIRLFAEFGGPSTRVFAGKVTPDFYKELSKSTQDLR